MKSLMCFWINIFSFLILSLISSAALRDTCLFCYFLKLNLGPYYCVITLITLPSRLTFPGKQDPSSCDASSPAFWWWCSFVYKLVFRYLGSYLASSSLVRIHVEEEKVSNWWASIHLLKTRWNSPDDIHLLYPKECFSLSHSLVKNCRHSFRPNAVWKESQSEIPV